MANPWTDPEKARRWQPTGKPGQARREEALAVVFALIDVHAPRWILDLGCGIGDIDARLLERYPDARLVGVDASPGMLARAQEQLAAFGERVSLHEGALEAAWGGVLDRPFDVVLASQVIHHLEADAKRAVFTRVHAVLAPGGLFVLNDRLAFAAAFHPHHRALRNATRRAHGFEPSPDETFAEYAARERAGGDVPDLLTDQLRWLREAGFAQAESFWQHGDKAVFAALKA